MFYAQEEAQRFKAMYVNTEHLLLGLCRDHDSSAARVLDKCGVSLADVREEVEKTIPAGDSFPTQDMTLTPRSKRVIDLAYDEARNLNNNYIGTEHLILGMIREADGVAGKALAMLGVTLEQARKATIEIQDAEGSPPRGNDQLIPPPPVMTQARRQLRYASETMLLQLLIRQGRMSKDLLAMTMLSAAHPSTSALFEKMGVGLSTVIKQVEQELFDVTENLEVEGAGGVSAALSSAFEEAELSSQTLAPKHFVPALFRSEQNVVHDSLREKNLTLEQIRSALREAGA